MMFADKKVIIFDMDGTLIDSINIWNQVDVELIKRIRRDGQQVDEDVQAQRDAALRKFAKDAAPYISYCRFLGEKYGSDLTPEEIHTLRYEIAQDFLENVIDYKPAAEELIKKLKAEGYKLCIATTTRRKNMDIYRTKNKNIREKANLDDYFHPIYTREDAKEMKPHPEIYLTVMKYFDVKPEECLVFEDSLIGIEAANRAGIEAVAVYDKYSDGEREEINQLATYQIREYAELLG